MEDGYVCTLDEVDLKKAKEELNEDPKERLGQAQALRDWIKTQPHLRAPTDNATMIRWLRAAKFSQLRARELVDLFYTNFTKYPEWFQNLDPQDPKVQQIAKTGHMFVLPGRDKERRLVCFQITGSDIDKIKDVKFDDIIRSMMCLNHLKFIEEKTQVHGLVMFADWTNMSMASLQKMGMDGMRKWHKAWQGNAMSRMKGFHYYNVGTIFETVMAIFRPLMPKKFLNRIHIHETLESVYKDIPMEMLPREYLPDEYDGPCAGTLQELKDEAVASMNAPGVREKMLEFSSPKWGVDESKRIKQDEPAASFRKLNID